MIETMVEVWPLVRNILVYLALLACGIVAVVQVLTWLDMWPLPWFRPQPQTFPPVPVEVDEPAPEDRNLKYLNYLTVLCKNDTAQRDRLIQNVKDLYPGCTERFAIEKAIRDFHRDHA